MSPLLLVSLSQFTAGAAGYALKDEASDTLAEAIRAVARGERWIAQRVAQKLAHKPEEPRSASGTPNRPRTRDL